MKNQDATQGKTAYQEVRSAFEGLNLDGKATFLIEAVLSTTSAAVKEIAKHIEHVVTTVSGEMEEEEVVEAEAPAPKTTTRKTRAKSTTRKRKPTPKKGE